MKVPVFTQHGLSLREWKRVHGRPKPTAWRARIEVEGIGYVLVFLHREPSEAPRANLLWELERFRARLVEALAE